MEVKLGLAGVVDSSMSSAWKSSANLTHRGIQIGYSNLTTSPSPQMSSTYTYICVAEGNTLPVAHLPLWGFTFHRAVRGCTDQG